jgi:hypothetical protein
MRNNRPIIQVIAITVGTIILSLMVIFVLIGDVRQEALRLVSGSLGLIVSLRFHPLAWQAALALVMFVVIYWVARTVIYFSIPGMHKSHKCPLCDHSIQRAHRRKPERALSVIFMLRIGRFNCVNCNWSGLRRYHKHQAQ